MPDGKPEAESTTRLVNTPARTETQTEEVATAHVVPKAASPGRLRSERRTFAPGELVAGRYLIVRFIARGGMGEVYEAYDRELRVQVALKTVPPETAQNDTALGRLRREIALARRVTHRNVCRLFDVGFHHRAPSSASETDATPALPTETIAFFTMELLTGETLADRLDRLGPQRPEAAWPLLRQMAAALDAAHRAGVVHRDFKSDNVFLVPDDLEPGGLRAVVTDFGLALSRAPGLHTATLSVQGEVLGTPVYMAPEQIDPEWAAPLTPAADIYALGVVLYEMVTGRPPFAEKTALATALKRLQEAPPSPRRLRPELPRTWERAILRCLERDPKRRWPSATQLADTLASDPRPAHRSVGRRNWALVVPLAVLLCLTVVLARRFHRLRGPESGRSGSRAADATSIRRSVAVLGFKNLSGRPESAWLSTALQEMLSTDLAAGEKLRLIPGEDVGRMKLDLRLSEADSYARDTLARIRKHLGADVVVLGSYLALGQEAGSRLRLDLRLQDAMTGDTLAAVQVAGTEAELLELVAQAGGQLRDKLGVTRLSQHEQAGVGTALPRNVEAARLYSEGLARLRRLDVPGARALLERAVALEPEHALLHSALGEAYGQLGYATQARDEAQRALDLSWDLFREGKLLVEARYREATGEWERASQIYLSLFEFFPDHLEYGLRLAESLAQAGRDADALDLTDRLRKLPPPANEDPRIDLVEAQAAEGLPELQRAHAAAVRAAAKANTSGQRLLAGRALLQQASDEVFLGERSQALKTIVSAKQLLMEAGDRAGVAEALEIIATRLYVRGDTLAAIKLAEEAAATFEDNGNLGRQAIALTRLGFWLLCLSHSAQGQARLAQAERAALASRERLPLLAARMYRSYFVTFQIEGQVVAASHELEELGRDFHELPASDWSIYNRLFQGRLLREQDDLMAAERILKEALALTGRGSHRLSASFGLLLLGETSLAAGQAVEAEHQARHALAEMGREGGLPPRQTRARAVLAGALLAQGKTVEARHEAERAAALAAQTDDLIFLLPALAETARVRLALGQPDDLAAARALVTDGLTVARRGRFFSEELALRLILGELELKTGNPAGRAQLQAVAREAEARGLGLIARRARQASR